MCTVYACKSFRLPSALLLERECEDSLRQVESKVAKLFLILACFNITEEGTERMRDPEDGGGML